MTMYRISRQKNGNYTYILYSDGTKFRQDVSEYKPIFPETMDVKITNYCDAGCYFCHENSTREGLHGELDQNYWKGCGSQEIAIGGGNPLSHPDLDTFLHGMKEQRKICNITVNSFHAQRADVSKRLEKLRSENLVFGVGISYHPIFFDKVFFNDENMVVHLIIGIHPIEMVKKLLERRKLKILLLGYKSFGRGVKYKPTGLEEWKKGWDKLPAKSISLDNLAIEQLGIDTTSHQNYLGSEGNFSMYIDLVEKQFAVSSYSKERYPISSCINDFSKVRQLIN